MATPKKNKLGVKNSLVNNINARKEKISALKLERQRNYTYMGMAGILALIVFSFFIVRERGKSERERKKSEKSKEATAQSVASLTLAQPTIKQPLNPAEDSLKVSAWDIWKSIELGLSFLLFLLCCDLDRELWIEPWRNRNLIPLAILLLLGEVFVRRCLA